MQEHDGTKLSKTEALWRAVRCSNRMGWRTDLVDRKPILANNRGELAKGKWGTKVMWEKQSSWQLSAGVVFCA